MASREAVPALTDARGLGGLVAQEGFDYQLWDALARVPAWLTHPAFESLLFEGLEDYEARFFAPQWSREGFMLDRYQAKGSALEPADIRAVLTSFLEFETRFPQVARVQSLITPQVPSKLRWIVRDPGRVRRARPFYAPFEKVVEASESRLKNDLAAEFGEELGSFVFQSVEVIHRQNIDRDSALITFHHELELAFPSLEAGAKAARRAFAMLEALIRRSLGSPLSREILVRTLEEGLGQSLALAETFAVHVRSDRNEPNERAFEFDASAFSGGDRPFPAPPQWTSSLVQPLIMISKWLRGRKVCRIALGGSYRLSTALALGWVFRSAVGFEFEIATRTGLWMTDQWPRADSAPAVWQIVQPQNLDGRCLNVSIGVIRDPAADLEATSGTATIRVLRIHRPVPLTSGAEVQSSVSVIKAAVDQAVARLKPEKIDLFLAGPAAFAVALGHRWNAMPPTQMHEFLAQERRYVATVVL